MLDALNQGVPAWLVANLDPARCAILWKNKGKIWSLPTRRLWAIGNSSEESAGESQQNGGSISQVIARTQQRLVSLSKQARMLEQRLQSFEDRKDDLENWRRVASSAVEVASQAQTAQRLYQNTKFQAETERPGRTCMHSLRRRPYYVEYAGAAERQVQVEKAH